MDDGGGGGSWENSRNQSSVEPEQDHEQEPELEPEPESDVPINMFDDFDWTRDEPEDVSISAKRQSQPVVPVKRVAQLSNAPRAVSMEVQPRRGEPPEVVVEAEPPAIPVVVVSEDQQPHNEGASALGRGSISNSM